MNIFLQKGFHRKDTPLVIETINFRTESLTFQKWALRLCLFHLRYKSSLIRICLIKLRIVMFHNKNNAFGKNCFLDICLCVFKKLIYYHFHCVKCVCIRIYSGPHFLTFGLNMERYSVFNPNAKKYGTVQLRYGHFSRSTLCLRRLFDKSDC